MRKLQEHGRRRHSTSRATRSNPWLFAALLGGLLAAPPSGHAQSEAPTYRLYVANESSDLVSRVAFTPGRGVVIEKEIPVGVMPGDNDGAHGITVSPDGEFWYVTIAHGTPFGSVWKFRAGPDTLVGRSQLGLFPATMGVTPDGQFLMAVNFNLHGDMVPSDVSVVYTPNMVEIAKIETCLMPHGSRVRVDGTRQYSTCMHSDQLVEIDVNTFEISSRFDLTPGQEGPLMPVGHAASSGHDGAMAGMANASAPVCSPTWAEPATGDRANRVVYVACNKNQEILEIDTDEWRVTRRFAAGKAPYNLEVTADGRLLVATLKGEQGIAVFDLESGNRIGRLDASQPITHGVASSPDGRYAFISNEAVGSVPGTLDVVDLQTLEVVASVALRHQSGGIDFWTMTSGPGGG